MYKKIKETGWVGEAALGMQGAVSNSILKRKGGEETGSRSGGSQTNQFMALPRRSLENADASLGVCCAC